ncbi:NusB antitermination factor [Verrucomicrobium sp. GAS474]|uniref:transcription antitermination factor NusB n=1 Tax=Verrucomicrobium sp. GAS474 TaxID=1882831 RepID=UPI00087C55BD|nr:transcription antitermination factor NusB [Verrucomicrobium sp. GAS474]SDU16341.1 NusB antitermination factor [Verrucomicrobium sp. GAS474]
MSLRRLGRECAVQFLYQHHVDAGTSLNKALELFWPLREIEGPTREFADALIRGVFEHLAAIDEKIKAYADNWDFERIATVDLAILRLAVYELLYRDDIPPVVSINEGIEIAKRFSSEESGRFVNGILDRVRKDLLRPARHAAGGS